MNSSQYYLFSTRNSAWLTPGFIYNSDRSQAWKGSYEEALRMAKAQYQNRIEFGLLIIHEDDLTAIAGETK